LRQKGKLAAMQRVAVRSVLLFVLGVIYYGGFSKTFNDVRLLGVLQRIALCYLFAGLLFVLCKPRWLAVACAALLLGYWALMTLVPVPGIGAGVFEPGRNLANYIDSQVLPLAKWNRDWDPEGLLSTLPAAGTCLLGVLAGLLLKNNRVPAQRKVYWLCGAGAVFALAGFLWSLEFPIIKQIWTSSYVLVTGGFSTLALAGFYQIMEIWNRRLWAAPLVWIGSNAIALYMLFGWPGSPLRGGLFSFHDLANRLVGGSLKTVVFRQNGELVVATVVVALVLCLAYALYRRKIFIRL
jgi:predicted acyltransferase